MARIDAMLTVALWRVAKLFMGYWVSSADMTRMGMLSYTVQPFDTETPGEYLDALFFAVRNKQTEPFN